MGWRPQDVRAASLSDFAAAFRGWKMSQGIKDEEREITAEDRAWLDDMLRKYGNG